MSDLHLSFYPRPTGDACQYESYHDNPAMTSSQRTNIRSLSLNGTEPSFSTFRNSVGILPASEGVSKPPPYVRCRSRMEDHEPSLIFV